MSKRLGADLRGSETDSVRVVEELQLAQRGQVQVLRNVLQLQTPVTVRPADSAARGRESTLGMTRELRSNSAIAVFADPIAVGSFFQIAFDRSGIDLPPVFARCDRCTMQAEGEFEARFHFLNPVVLPAAGSNPGD